MMNSMEIEVREAGGKLKRINDINLAAIPIVAAILEI